MANKKLKDTEKSPTVLSFNAKEDCLLKKKLLALDSMKKQAADSLTLDQKVLYNRFTLKLRRSELAHARLVGNKALIKHLTNSLFSNFNTTLDNGTGEALRNIIKNRNPLRAASAPCRPFSSMTSKSDKDSKDLDDGQVISSISGKQLIDFGDFKTNRKLHKTHHRFYSAPGTRQTERKQVRIYNFDKGQDETTDLATAASYSQTHSLAKIDTTLKEEKDDKQTLKFKDVPEAWPVSKEKNTDQVHSPKNMNQMKKRPKSTTFLSVAEGEKVNDFLEIKEKVLSCMNMDLENKVRLFIEGVKTLQEQDVTLKDYYSQRMVRRVGKKDILTVGDEHEEQKQWMPVGEEKKHRSITIKRLDRNVTRRDIPTDILFMEHYNAVVTKENFTVRHWHNNNPYLPATEIHISG